MDRPTYEAIQTNRTSAILFHEISDAGQHAELPLRKTGEDVDSDKTTEAQSESSNPINEHPTPEQQVDPPLGDTYKAYDNFQLFSELPIELRLKIWRFSFLEARHVSLDTAYGYPLDADELHPEFQKFLEHPLPISLYVNHESRTETLRHYTVPFLGDILRPLNTVKTFDRPFWFDPSRESLWLEPESLETLDFSESTWIEEWLDLIDKKSRGGTSSIRTLERFHHAWQHIGDFSDIWNFAGVSLGREGNSKRSGLEWFHGLEKVILTSCNPTGADPEVIQRRVKDWYQNYQAREPTCRIPEVIFRDNKIAPRYGVLG